MMPHVKASVTMKSSVADMGHSRKGTTGVLRFLSYRGKRYPQELAVH